MHTDVIDARATADRTVPRDAADPGRARAAGLWSLPEVRWATLATGLFLIGLAAHFGPVPDGRRGACSSPPTPPAAGSPAWPA